MSADPSPRERFTTGLARPGVVTVLSISAWKARDLLLEQLGDEAGLDCSCCTADELRAWLQTPGPRFLHRFHQAPLALRDLLYRGPIKEALGGARVMVVTADRAMPEELERHIGEAALTIIALPGEDPLDDQVLERIDALPDRQIRALEALAGVRRLGPEQGSAHGVLASLSADEWRAMGRGQGELVDTWPGLRLRAAGRRALGRRIPWPSLTRSFSSSPHAVERSAAHMGLWAAGGAPQDEDLLARLPQVVEEASDPIDGVLEVFRLAQDAVNGWPSGLRLSMAPFSGVLPDLDERLRALVAPLVGVPERGPRSMRPQDDAAPPPSDDLPDPDAPITPTTMLIYGAVVLVVLLGILLAMGR